MKNAEVKTKNNNNNNEGKPMKTIKTPSKPATITVKNETGETIIPKPKLMLQDEKISFGMVEIDGYGRLSFEDAKIPQTVEVRDTDIKSAVCEDPRSCVLAKACKRSFGKSIHDVIVFRTVVHIIYLNADGSFHSIRYGLGKMLQKAVKNYDASRRADGSGTWGLPVGIYRFAVPTDKRGDRENRRHKHGGKGGKQQKGERQMQAMTRCLLARNKNATPQFVAEAVAR